jgi:regulator of sirC expression with transglutaminase-like and TPR domain
VTGPTDRFAALVRRPDGEIPLDEAALLIAAHAHPDLEVEAELARLDAVAAGCAEPTLDGLRRHLFEELGFIGNRRRYGDPHNSFLNDVVSRRVGIPISLSVLTMEVGRRVGVPLVGIGLPGHFLVRHEAGAGEVLDPFGGGTVLDRAGCEALLQAVYGPGATLPEQLPVSGRRAILARMLANLRQLYLAAGDAPAAGWVYRLRAAIPPDVPSDHVEVARALASLGRFTEAADTLEDLAERVDDAGAAQARARAGSLRALLN